MGTSYPAVPVCLTLALISLFITYITPRYSDVWIFFLGTFVIFAYIALILHLGDVRSQEEASARASTV